MLEISGGQAGIVLLTSTRPSAAVTNTLIALNAFDLASASAASAIASASASCKNHLGPSWTDWIENGHPLGLTNGQQKLSWSDMSPALDLEKLIFEAAEVANVVA